MKRTPGPVNTVPGTGRGALPALHPVAHPLFAHFSALSSPETGVDSRGAQAFATLTLFRSEVFLGKWLAYFVSCMHSVRVAVVGLGRILYTFVSRPPAVQVQLREAEGLLGSGVESTDHIWGSFEAAVGLSGDRKKCDWPLWFYLAIFSGPCPFKLVKIHHYIYAVTLTHCSVVDIMILQKSKLKCFFMIRRLNEGRLW